MKKLVFDLILAATILVAARAARAQATAPRSFRLEAAESEVVYHLVHKLHKVEGRTKAVDGRALVGADGRLQVVVRVPTTSFDSGNANRDAHMKEVVEAARYPTLEVRALSAGVQLPGSDGVARFTAKAQVDFHGVKQTFDIPIELRALGGGRQRAVVHFPISLEAFKVERPSLLFVKVDDSVQIDATVVFAEERTH